MRTSYPQTFEQLYSVVDNFNDFCAVRVSRETIKRLKNLGGKFHMKHFLANNSMAQTKYLLKSVNLNN